MKKLFVFLGVILSMIGSAVSAQEVDSIAPLQKSSWGDAKISEAVDYIPDVSFDMRYGYGQDFTGRNGKLYGNGIYFNVDGKIGKNFSYSWQQRFATSDGGSANFNNTSWLNLTYSIGSFEITAGKQDIHVGNFEYDDEELGAYYEMSTMFYNNFACWQWGVSASWYPVDNHSICIQATNSPFSVDFADMFAYALSWRMESDCYESYWSVNLWELQPAKYVGAVNLGNRFHFGNFDFDLEYMTRAAAFKRIFTDDFSLTAAPSYTIADQVRIFGKFGWERTAEGLPYELAYTEALGKDRLFYGAGVEYFPLKNDDLRLHAAWSSNNFGEHYLDIGIKWHFSLTKAAKHIFNKLSNER